MTPPDPGRGPTGLPMPSPAVDGTFARFQILGVLGQGGMGVVYRARDPQLEREVALKLLLGVDGATHGSSGSGEQVHNHQALGGARTGDAAATRGEERFRREARALSRVEHPGVCRLYEVGSHDGIPYLVMERVPGRPLAAHISGAWLQGAPLLPGMPGGDVGGAGAVPRRPADVRAVAALVAGAARALHAAHALGVIHRDVKPANIMVREDGSPVLLDFGLARDETTEELRLTGSEESLGTPQYMAPEQVQPGVGTTGAASVGPWTDVHGLGLVLFECLTLRVAFERATRHELLEAILKQPARDVRTVNLSVPRDLAVICRTALEKEPSHRYRDAAALADDLDRFLRGDSILAQPPGIWRSGWRWAKRNRLSAALLAAVTAIAVGAPVALLVVNRALTSAERSLDSFDKLAIVRKLRLALDQVDQLFPAMPDTVPAIVRWQSEYAQPLLAQLPMLRTAVEDLTAREARRDGSGDPLSESERVLLETLQANLADLEAFAAPGDGVAAVVSERLVWARSIASRSVEAYREPWNQAIGRVKNSAQYAGLVLEPQVGLVPLGADPGSGLEEFLDLRTQDRRAPLPRRVEGVVEVTEAMGVVFVLLPGGEHPMGSPESWPGSTVQTEADERPRHRVQLAPFLISKFELTQAQWVRMAGSNPSRYQPGSAELGGLQVSLVHPVDRVGTIQARRMLARYAMALPTEAQWEYAAAGGTEGPWFTGDTAASVDGYGNIRDAASTRAFRDGLPGAPWRDGHIIHAPVGSFPPNPYGLHDTIGNQYELCLDWKVPYDQAPSADGSGLREPDGDVLAAGGLNRVARGGSWYNPVDRSRTQNRHPEPEAEVTEAVFGIRPVRPLR